MRKVGFSARSVIVALLSVLMALCLVRAFVPLFGNAEGGMEAAYVYTIGDKSLAEDAEFEEKSDTEFIYRDFSAGYNAAIAKAKEIRNLDEPYVKVVLASDWTATVLEQYDIASFGEGAGFLLGRIYVPDGVHIILDLNGNVIDRNLSDFSINGNALYVQGDLVLCDGNVTAEHSNLSYGGNKTVKGGVITGGNAQNGGGIYVAEYGALTMYGGTVFNNTARANGGGISVSNYATFRMYGGSVIGNTARNGGGLSIESGDVYFEGGDIVDNTASFYGGGIYFPSPESEGFIELYGMSITDNIAYTGGGLYFIDCRLRLECVEISENMAEMGGGVYGRNTNDEAGLFVQGLVVITDNLSEYAYDNLYLGRGTYFSVYGSLEEGSKITLSSPDIVVSRYDDFGSSTNMIVNDEGDRKTVVDPSLYFDLDCGDYEGQYHIVRDQENASSYGTTYGSLRITKYYVEWYVNELDSDGLKENGNKSDPVDDPLYVTFAITDYGSENNDYRVGFTARIYTLGAAGSKNYVGEIDDFNDVTVYYPGQGTQYSYAPIYSYGKYATDNLYSACFTYGGETFWTMLDVTAKSIADDNVTVTVTLKEENFYYKFVNSRGDLSNKAINWNELFDISVVYNEETLVYGEDYSVSIPYYYPHVCETFTLEIRGINLFGGLIEKTYSLNVNENIYYTFMSWQYSQTQENVENNVATLIYSGADLAQSIRLKLALNDVDGKNELSSLNLSESRLVQYGCPYTAYDSLTDRGLKFKIVKVEGNVETPVTEMIDTGTYKIIFDKEASDKANVLIDQIEAPALTVNVVERAIDFTSVTVDYEEATVQDGVQVVYFDEVLNAYVTVPFLKKGETYIYIDGEEGKGATVSGTEDYKYVYFNGKEFTLAFNGLEIDGVNIVDEIESGKVTVTCEAGTSSGEVNKVKEFTTTVTFTFVNYCSAADNTKKQLQFEFKWAIVTAGNGLVKVDGDTYVLGFESIDYGASEGFTVPKMQYGYGTIVVGLYKDGDKTNAEYFAVTNLQSGAAVLNEYDAANGVGAEINSTFEEYINSIILDNGVGAYTLTVLPEPYTDYQNDITYYAYESKFNFTVTARDISADSKNFRASVASSELRYTGAEQTPVMIVTFFGNACVQGVDYTLSYSNNINAGKATVTVKGIGNLSGSVNVEFEINSAVDNEWTVLRISDWWYTEFDTVTNTVIAVSRYGSENAKFSIERYIADGDATEAIEGLSKFTVSETGAVPASVAQILRDLPRGRYALIAETVENSNYNVARQTYGFEVHATAQAKPTLTVITSGSGANNVYTGTTLSIAVKDFNSAAMTISIDEKLERVEATLYAVNAGTYTVTFTLKDSVNSAWDDGSSRPVVLKWTIAPQTVQRPTAGNNSFVITGNTQTYIPDGFDETLMNIENNAKTDADLYACNISLKDPNNYVWDDGTNASFSLPWEIEDMYWLFVTIACIIAGLALIAILFAVGQYVNHRARMRDLAEADKDPEGLSEALEKETEGGNE